MYFIGRGEDYDRSFAEREAGGHDVHGEATLVASLSRGPVLDAGCGTGRVAIELARRGLRVAGVDVDAEMLATARHKSPELEWVQGDLATLDLRDGDGRRRRFAAVVMAGNVMVFLARGTEARVVGNMGAHLARGGLLIAGFQIRHGGLDAGEYEAYALAAGLTLRERWSTWDRAPWSASADYVVSVHQAD
ncbi:MAG: class I SAM-dependent methyltransferase [Candidatus Dormibacteria bacterium]